MPRDLYKVALDEGTQIRRPVVVESRETDAETTIRRQFGAPGSGEGHPYINLRETPGSVSLWLGPDCVVGVDRVGHLTAAAHESPTGWIAVVQ